MPIYFNYNSVSCSAVTSLQFPVCVIVLRLSASDMNDVMFCVLDVFFFYCLFYGHTAWNKDWLIDWLIDWLTFSEKDQHAKHLQDLEDDMETQMQKAMQRVRSEVTLALTLTSVLLTFVPPERQIWISFSSDVFSDFGETITKTGGGRPLPSNLFVAVRMVVMEILENSCE